MIDVTRNRNRIAVNNAPTISGGDRLNATLRPGPEKSGVAVLRALRSMDQPAMSSATTASTSQTNSQLFAFDWRLARYAVTRAVAPIITCPQPGTAVNAEARSIVSRM